MTELEDSLSQAMQELKQAALQVKAERDRMKYALDNILLMTAGNPDLRVIYDQARKGLGDL